MIFAPKPCGPLHHGVMLEDAAVAEFDFIADHGEGADFEPCPIRAEGETMRAGIDFAHRAPSRRADRVAPRASAAELRRPPSCTSGCFGGEFAIHGGASFELAEIRAAPGDDTLTSIRSWSPGMTGRRKRALSMATK